MTKSMLLSAAVLIGAHACAPNPVPVIGASTDVATLTGEWVGEYSSGESGREGNIVFKLEAGADTAHGDVMMIPLYPDRPYSPPINEYDPTRVEELRGFLLTISWVAVENNRIEGTLSPYKDPECGCQLETVFTGTIDGDEITGTYRSLHIGSAVVQSGYWSVHRKQ